MFAQESRLRYYNLGAYLTQQWTYCTLEKRA